MSCFGIFGPGEQSELFKLKQRETQKLPNLWTDGAAISQASPTKMTMFIGRSRVLWSQLITPEWKEALYMCQACSVSHPVVLFAALRQILPVMHLKSNIQSVIYAESWSGSFPSIPTAPWSLATKSHVEPHRSCSPTMPQSQPGIHIRQVMRAARLKLWGLLGSSREDC